MKTDVNELVDVIRWAIKMDITGVMQLLSKCSPLLFSDGTYAPLATRLSRTVAMVITFSAISLEALNRRERCWFILALGALDVYKRIYEMTYDLHEWCHLPLHQ